MASVEAISAAIKSLPSKKENLRKAFEDLQAHSSCLASFTLQWEDLEKHFESIEKSIKARLKDLEDKEKSVLPETGEEHASRPLSAPQVSLSEETLQKQQPEEPQKKAGVCTVKVKSTSKPELEEFCRKMDAVGLRKYIINSRNELSAIQDELAGALQCASDPAKLVLDAMGGFFRPNSKGDKDTDVAALRRTCILLLEKLSEISTEIRTPMKERAKKIAIEWKGKITPGGQNLLEILGFLQIVATFGFLSSFDIDQVMDLIVEVCRRKQIVDFCRDFIPADKIPHLIQKMISKGKHIDAARYAYTFGLIEKFPPVPLLEAHLSGAKKLSEEIRKKGNNSTMSQHEAISRETAAINSVVKLVEEHNLGSKISCENLQKRIAQLESQRPAKKRSAPQAEVMNKSKLQPEKKRARPTGSSFAALSLNTPVVKHEQFGPVMINRVPSYMTATASGMRGLSGQAGGGYDYPSGGPSFVGSLGLSARRSPPRAPLLSNASSLYDRSVLHGYTSSSGASLLPSYRSFSSLYP